MSIDRRQILKAVAVTTVFGAPAVRAQKREAPGVTDTEILIGSTQPISGPASAYSNGAKVADSYFNVINKQGGINGRMIKFVQRDDGFTPQKAVEQTRRLVEQDKVAMMFASVGTTTNLAVRPYLNEQKVPQLFIGTAAATWNDDIDKYPWSLGWAPLYSDEGASIAKFILAKNRASRIALLYQNDGAATDLTKGFKAGLGSSIGQLVKEQSAELNDPTVDSQVLALQSSGADTFVTFVNVKFSAQAIRKAFDSGWKPQIYLMSVSTSLPQTLVPAGLERALGVRSAAYVKDPADSTWASDKAMQEFIAFMNTNNPNLPKDNLAVEGLCKAQTLVALLRKCGDDLRRENIIEQTKHLEVDLPLLLPGLSIKTSATNRHPLRTLRMQQFDGSAWKLLPTT